MTRNYCKIFVDGKTDRPALLSLVSRTIGGSVNGSSVESRWGDWDVRGNDTYDGIEVAGEEGLFIFYPWCVEVEPTDDNLPMAYVADVAQVLEGMWSEGLKAVAACDFEEDLPRGGGITSA